MKTQIAFKFAVVSAMAITLPTAAQTFSGINAPNTGTDFSFSLGAGATNPSLVISNSAIELNKTSGDGNVAVRRSSVPNEWNNDAFSEVPGQVREQILLVPPTLSDGPRSRTLRLSPVQ